MAQLRAQQSAPPGVTIGEADLGGVVTGPNGPEAGVWVIAETTDLPTKFAKIVVTDDRGRYVMPDLPKANYNVWVRGYGLVDSPKVQRARQDPRSQGGARAERDGGGAILSGDLLVLDAQGPGQERVSRHGPTATASPRHEEPGQWLNVIKTDGCYACHALGNKATRTIPQGVGPIHELGGGVGAAHPVRAGHDQHDERHRPARRRSARSSCSPTGPIGSPPASCPLRSRRGRRASSATSSSR